ncbi:hypothetical protein ACLOJK_023650 [Asimina triloba]
MYEIKFQKAVVVVVVAVVVAVVSRRKPQLRKPKQRQGLLNPSSLVGRLISSHEAQRSRIRLPRSSRLATQMADALSVIPAAVIRSLSDKLYEKRKNAALEKLEGVVKQLAAAGDHDRITAVINLLTTEFTYSPQANHRKGGLIGLAAATVGLTAEAAQHLEVRHPSSLL